MALGSWCEVEQEAVGVDGHRRLCLNAEERSFPGGVTEHGGSWTRGGGDVLRASGHWLQVALLEQGGYTRWPPEVLSCLSCSVIL